MKSVGIWGVGVYLPEIVRGNDHWSPAVVDKWRDRLARRAERINELFAKEDGAGAKLVHEQLEHLASDPFQGCHERRVMPSDMSAVEMNRRAAEEAITRAGIDRSEIDVVLGFTLCPDYINVPDACAVHHQLGLRPDCFTLNVDAVCNSFMMQMMLARSMIQSGQARYALIIQSSAITRLPESYEPHDSWLGDGASAVVLGPVSDGKGVLSFATRTDGSLAGALVCGVPDGHWASGRDITYSRDHYANFNMFARIVDRAKEVLDDCLADAKLAPADIDFYSCHQAMLWLRSTSQRFIGMTNARWVDTFPWAGSVSAANLPLVLSLGEKEGLLKDGDRVAMFQGGTGMTWTGMVLRWGR